jgi:hypothetical protein
MTCLTSQDKDTSKLNRNRNRNLNPPRFSLGSTHRESEKCFPDHSKSKVLFLQEEPHNLPTQLHPPATPGRLPLTGQLCVQTHFSTETVFLLTRNPDIQYLIGKHTTAYCRWIHFPPCFAHSIFFFFLHDETYQLAPVIELFVRFSDY